MNMEKRASSLSTFMDLWKGFYDAIEAARAKETVTPEEESAFLDIKAKIVQYQAILDLDILTGQELSGSIISLVSQAISLKDVQAQSPTQIKKIESDWHNIYMSLHALMGKIKKKQEDHVNYSSKGGLKKVLFNPLFIIIVLVAIIVLIFNYIYTQKNAETPQVEEQSVSETMLYLDKDDYIS